MQITVSKATHKCLKSMARVHFRTIGAQLEFILADYAKCIAVVEQAEKPARGVQSSKAALPTMSQDQ